jgi:hypothetical protein
MGDTINVYGILIGKPERNGPPGRHSVDDRIILKLILMPSGGMI